MTKFKPHKSPRVTLEPDLQKIIEAICLLIHEAAERKLDGLSQYDIVKALFLADRSHLNTYGRPITFDNYVAMKDGPVPTVAYDLLKENARTLSKFGIDKLPWQKTEYDKHFLYSLRSAYRDKDVLSKSDKTALADALTIIKRLTFGQIRSLTHNDPAYNEAWNDDGDSKSYEISLGMLFDSPNFEAAEQVAFLSKHK